MLLISIDGACRRNGKPDCVSSGGVFYCDTDNIDACGILSAYEYCSTNQRGELLALLKALDFACNDTRDTYIITDSEYIFNAMTKQWYRSWNKRGWVTSSGDAVKNKDIWLEILMIMNKYDELAREPYFYHIKGHCLSFGRVTADNLLAHDPSGMALYNAVSKKYDSNAKASALKIAQDLSERNNGFTLPDSTLKSFVVINTVADAIATKVVDAADRRS